MCGFEFDTYIIISTNIYQGVAQLVARKAGGLEVVGSSPATLIFFVKKLFQLLIISMVLTVI